MPGAIRQIGFNSMSGTVLSLRDQHAQTGSVIGAVTEEGYEIFIRPRSVLTNTNT